MHNYISLCLSKLAYSIMLAAAILMSCTCIPPLDHHACPFFIPDLYVGQLKRRPAARFSCVTSTPAADMKQVPLLDNKSSSMSVQPCMHYMPSNRATMQLKLLI